MKKVIILGAGGAGSELTFYIEDHNTRSPFNDSLYLFIVREAIPKKNLLIFGHCPKGGGGVQPESKLFEALLKKLHFFRQSAS